MSIIERVTGAAITKPLAIGLAVSLFANLVGGLWLRAVIAERDGADSKLSTAVEANAGNWQLINAQRDSLEACVGLDQFMLRLSLQATADFEAAKAERKQAAADRRADRGKTYATDASCKAWGDAPVCVAIDNGLSAETAGGSD